MEEPIAAAVIGVVMVRGRSGTMQAKAYEFNSWRDAAGLVISLSMLRTALDMVTVGSSTNTGFGNCWNHRRYA